MSDEVAQTEIALHAYVDEQLDPAERGRIEALLHEDPERAALVAEWARQNAALRAIFGNLPAQPMPADRRPEARHKGSLVQGQGLSRIAAAIVLFLAGGIAGWFINERFAREDSITLTQASDLVTSALAAHRVYSVEVRHPVEVTSSEEDHLVRWLSKRIGAPLIAPDLTTHGFSLVGGRLLPAHAGAAAQFMYENTQGQRITMYVTGNPENSDTSFRMAEVDGVNVYYWLDGPLGIAVAGPIARDELMKLVRIAYEQIDRKLQSG